MQRPNLNHRKSRSRERRDRSVSDYERSSRSRRREGGRRSRSRHRSRSSHRRRQHSSRCSSCESAYSSRCRRKYERRSSSKRQERFLRKSSAEELSNSRSCTRFRSPPPSAEKKDSVNEKKEAINSDLMILLGEEPDSAVSGPPIHQLLAEKWAKILHECLPKEKRELLLKSYPELENFPLLKAPALNPEMKVIMGSSAVRRDNFHKSA